MISFIFGLLFAGLTLLAIGLQRTYYHYPAKELKRRARSGDPLAQMLYRPVSYGVSLRVLLWLIIVVSAAVAFVLFSHAFAAWFAVLVIGFLVWLGFLWLPSAGLTSVSTRLAMWASPTLNWLLGWLYPVLDRAGEFAKRHRRISIKTGLYEKEDLVELLDRQKHLPDNRIAKEDISLLQHALQFGDKQVRDTLTPLRTVRLVGAHESIGPKLMDELYKSGYSRFPVYEGEQSNIVATLYLRDLTLQQSKGHVKDVMRPDVFYIHENFTLRQALQAFLKTKHHLFIVVNEFEEFVGIITIEDILEQVIGKQIVDEFDTYDNMRAVAASAAKKDHKERKKAKQYPAAETKEPATDGEEPDIVVK